MYSLCLQNATTSSLLFPINNQKLSSKARFQCSIKTNNTNTKQVTNNNNKKVLILWDLDNKHPYGPPYNAAVNLKTLAERFGDVVSISAYAARHYFLKLPQWDPEENPNPNSLLCRVCGCECKSYFDLRFHFREVHNYPYQKWRRRLKSILIDRHKVKFIRKRHVNNENGRYNVPLMVGFGMASQLRRAGVFVKIVEDGDNKVNAADSTLKREMMMNGGVDWLILVSDDSEYSEMLKEVREKKLGNVVVVGDYWDRYLGKNADLWLPWNVVENGTVDGTGLMGRRTLTEGFDDEWEEEEDENVDDD